MEESPESCNVRLLKTLEPAFSKYPKERPLPVLVVEGPNDPKLFKKLGVKEGCIFIAGNRDAVVGLLEYHIRERRPEEVECVFLIDCDTEGKPHSEILQKEETRLLVTQCCDIEADLFAVGMVESALCSVMSHEDAAAYVDEAKQMSLPLSIVRRRANKASVSMKNIGLFDVAREVRLEWRDATPEWRMVLEHVRLVRPWSPEQVNLVKGQELAEPISFDRYALGKDTIDALFFLLFEDGRFEHRHFAEFSWIIEPRPNFKGFGIWLRDHAEKTDISNWEVGKRLNAWQLDRGVELIRAEI
jgi:hypothetical protein